MIIENVEKENASFITLTNSAGLKLTLCDYGAGIYSIFYDGKSMNVAPTDKKSWLNEDTYFGKTVGRIAGRLSKGRLNYLGNEYQLSVNEGENTLHGGKEGFSFRHFKMDVVHLGDSVAVDYYLVSPAGDMGFPGEIALRVRYIVKEDEPSFKIVYLAKSKSETPLNLTCHAYFNLGGEDDVEKQLLFVNSDETMSYDKELIPLGFKKSPSCLDFSTPKEIGKDIDDPYLTSIRTLGYDHCFLFKEANAEETQIRMESQDYVMDIKTSLPAAQIYSYNYPHIGEELVSGKKTKLHSGLAIEPVYKPGDFHSMSVISDTPKSDFIEYIFKKKGE
ncbi:MAG: hypothetical protein LKE31_07180 [Bacilli bacterium]|jgi:aldose 1-epimerase|nr:hypothetical protein [Bacilli bacterium]